MTPLRGAFSTPTPSTRWSTTAMAEVSGRIIDIEIDDDTASPFDISVVQANGRTVDLELDADMKVLSINPS